MGTRPNCATWIAWAGLLCLVTGLLACDPAARAAGAEPVATPTRAALVLVNGKPVPTPGGELDGQASAGCSCFDR